MKVNQVIRERVDSDLPALADALVEVYRVDGYPVEGVEDPTAWLRIQDYLAVWTAEVDGIPVGHVALSRPTDDDEAARILMRSQDVPRTDVAVVQRLFVAPSARGRKLGAALLSRAVEASLAMGMKPVLDVMEKDCAAIAIYERTGWVKLGSFAHMAHGVPVPAAAFTYRGQESA